mgnify:CR=1 FL=1
MLTRCRTGAGFQRVARFGRKVSVSISVLVVRCRVAPFILTNTTIRPKMTTKTSIPSRCISLIITTAAPASRTQAAQPHPDWHRPRRRTAAPLHRRNTAYWTQRASVTARV